MIDPSQHNAIARGYAAPGFECVSSALEAAAVRNGEAGCAVSAYLDGEKVVDLWWGSAADEPWREDTLVTVMSCTKGMVALCAQILVDRGLLDVDASVTTYWPEFGSNGKASMLVRHLLNHTAGVLTFPGYWNVTGMDLAGLANWEGMTVGLGAAPPSWEPGSRQMYHGYSFGYLVGELIRRVDGRTPGRFLAEEVAAPLGLEMTIGTPLPLLSRVAPSFLDAESRVLDEAQRRALADAQNLVRAGDVVSIAALPWSSTYAHPDTEIDSLSLALIDFMNSDDCRRVEMPSGNGITTARDLARMYAVLACGGELDGVRLFSRESVEQFSRLSQGMAVGGMAHTLGYHKLVPPFAVVGASEEAFGHGGKGGNHAFADPTYRLSFGFVKNRLHAGSWQTAADVGTAIYRCL